VFDKDEKKIYATLLAIPNDRLEPADKPVILFSERAAGTPQAVKVWYYPGERTGDEFVYPKSQAVRIAKATHQRVLAYNNEGSSTNTAGVVPESMKSAELGYFDENGTWQPSNERVAVTNERPAARQTASSQTAAPQTTTASTTGTSGARASRRSLPRTASGLELYELLSGLALAGGFALRSRRTR